MRFHARLALLATVAIALIAASAPAAAQAAFGVEKLEALTCTENEPEGKPKECSTATPAQFFTQAAGHPNFGVTDFKLNEFGTAGNGVKTIRTDLPVGFATNPQALPQCALSDFEANLDKAEANHCGASTEAGTQELTIVLEGPTFVTLTGKVFNLNPAPGLPLEFGIDVALPFLGGIHIHSVLEGGVSWHKEAEAEAEGIASGDYHEFFKIKVAKSLAEGEAPLARSRLVFNGKAGSGLLTTPTTCPGPQTTHLRVESFKGEVAYGSYTTTATSAEENCKVLKFEPAFKLTPSTTKSDAADGITTELAFPSNTSSAELENSDLKDSEVKLPEGLTINPSAANGLEACTSEQLNTQTEETNCPARSVLGSAVLDVPGLPPGSLTGKIFLGAPASGVITGPPYTIYVAVASSRYGQAVRLEGSVSADASTGQLTARFLNNPQGPFTNLKLQFNGNSFANLANPLTCGKAATNAMFVPYSGTAPVALVTEFPVEGCTSNPPPFALAQSASAEPAQGGGSSTFSFNLERPQGQQYLSQVRTTLAPGLLGTIPNATQCGEPQASKGECPASSQIGTSSVTAGSGSPFEFRGKVYLTGPYEGAPYGLSIVTPVVAGPFNLGNEVTRAKIEVNPFTAQVSVATTNLPTIKAGIPVRLRSLNVTINRQGFERNPTNCNPLAVVTAATSTLGAKAELSSPFQVEGCSSLAFKPTFSVTSSAKTSKNNGASLVTTITQPAGQANIKLVKVTLPKQLPSRLTTLQKACPQATFEANPFSCPAGSKVGTASVVTPVLPGKMTGPAFFVSHGGAAFPDLDLVLEDQGVRVILVGNTDIKKGITTTTFASNPDAPISSVTVSLPTASNSALGAFGDLCVRPLVMPTEVVAQNGKKFKQNTIINVTGCGVRIVGHKVVGNTAYLTVKTFAAGRISGSGSGLSTVSRRLGKATTTSLKVPLSARGRARRKPFSVRVRVGFVPSKKGPHSTATVTVRFR